MNATGVPVGHVVGGAVEGTVQKTDQKVAELENDHIVAIAERGEGFEIYIRSLGNP